MPASIEIKAVNEPASTDITIAPDGTVIEGDILIVAVAGGIGNLISEPDLTGFMGGRGTTTFSEDQVVAVVAGSGGTIPTFTWQYDTPGDLAAVLTYYRSGYLRGLLSQEASSTLTWTESFYGNPANCHIVFAGAGVSDGVSLWIQGDEDLYGLAADPDGLTSFGKLINAQTPAVVSGPPTTTGSVAALTAVQGTWRNTEMYFNGGTPTVNLVAAIGIDESNDDPATVGSGWHVGSVGWGGAWSA